MPKKMIAQQSIDTKKIRVPQSLLINAQTRLIISSPL